MPKAAGETQARAVPEAEATAIQAGIHLNTRRHDEARALLGTATGDGQLFREEALAYLAWSERKWPDARQHFANAVKLGADHPKLLYDAARVITYSGERDPEAAHLMRRAIDKFPEWKEARLHYGELLLYLGRPGEALSTLSEMKQVDANGVSRYYRTLGHSQLLLKRADLAEASAQRALKAARTEQETAQARGLVAAIERQQRYDKALAESRVHTQASAQANAQAPPPRNEAPVQTAEGEATPRLQRREILPAPTRAAGPQEKYEIVAGRLAQVDCLKEGARLTVQSGAQAVRLTIEDPTSVEIRGTGQGTAELTCGAGTAPVVVEYTPAVNAKLGTVGRVKVLEFR